MQLILNFHPHCRIALLGILIYLSCSQHTSPYLLGKGIRADHGLAAHFPNHYKLIQLFDSVIHLQTYLEAAKTQLVRGYKGLPASKITSTVGQNVGAIVYGGIKLNFWDLGGQEELQPLWEKVMQLMD